MGENAIGHSIAASRMSTAKSDIELLTPKGLGSPLEGIQFEA